MTSDVRLVVLPDGTVLLILEDAADAESMARMLHEQRPPSQRNFLIIGGHVEIEDLRK